MKRLIVVLMVLAVGMFLTTTATADDVEDIKKATLEHFATLNSGDVAAHIAHHLQGHTAFAADGGFLQVEDSLEEEKKSLQDGYDSGFRTNLQLRHLEVKVYGNAAVVTSYVVGTTTAPDGTIQQTRGRRTAVLIKRGNKWMEVHTHASPVMGAQSQ